MGALLPDFSDKLRIAKGFGGQTESHLKAKREGLYFGHAAALRGTPCFL